MHDEFDPYRQWLGRTATSRPLNYYQLLGLKEFESDAARIENAEMIEMAKVLRHESGPQADVARRLTAELEQAVATLCDPARKVAYDAELRSRLAGSAIPSHPQIARQPDLALSPADDAAFNYDSSADLRLSEEDEDELLDRATDVRDNDKAMPAEDGLAPGAVTAKPKKQIYASYDPQPLEKPRSLTFQLPSISLRPLLPAVGGIAIVGLLIWGVVAFLNSRQPVGQLEGKLTLDGQSVVGAQIRLESTTNPDHVFAGITGGDGAYQLSYRVFDGLPVGRYKITVSRQTALAGEAPKVDENDEVVADEGTLVTKVYVFEHDIVRGANAIDLELKQGTLLEPEKGG